MDLGNNVSTPQSKVISHANIIRDDRKDLKNLPKNLLGFNNEVTAVRENPLLESRLKKRSE
jgi:hypothetical protein